MRDPYYGSVLLRSLRIYTVAAITALLALAALPILPIKQTAKTELRPVVVVPAKATRAQQ
jgi:hypothetical protein